MSTMAEITMVFRFPLALVVVLWPTGFNVFAFDEGRSAQGLIGHGTDVPVTAEVKPELDARDPDSTAPEQARPTVASTADPLEQAIQGMRSAEARIGNRQADQQTLAIQDDVIRNLELLIERASRTKSAPSPDQQSSQSPQNSNTSTQPDRNEPNGSAPNGESQVSPRLPNPAGSNSEERLDPAQGRDSESANRGRLVNDVWGHLPPTLRNRLLNADREKFLPKYADEIRRYFQALAEQGRPTGDESNVEHIP